jgi:hypothetical protein
MTDYASWRLPRRGKTHQAWEILMANTDSDEVVRGKNSGGGGAKSRKPRLPDMLADLRKQKIFDNAGKAAAASRAPIPVPNPARAPAFADRAAARKELAALSADQATVEAAMRAGAGDTQAVSDFNAIRDPAKRHAQAKAFNAALGKVSGLHLRYDDLTDYVMNGRRDAEAREKAQQPVDAADAPAEWAKLGAEVGRTRMRLHENGLPDGYPIPTDDRWHERLIAQLAPFAQGDDPVRNEQLRKAVRDAAPTPGDKQAAKAAGDALKEATLKYQVRGLDRSSVFFDAGRNGVALSEEDRRKAFEANAMLLKMGCDILNSGGSYKQVQELMAASGIPEEAWPPQLVQSVQAWRKTQRALTEERVRSLLAKKPKGLPESPVERDTLDAVSTIFKDSGEFAEALREIAEKAEEAAKKAEEAATAADAISSGREAATTASEATESVEATTKAVTAAAWVNGVGSGLDGLLGLAQIVQGAKEFFELATDEEMPDRQRALAMLGAALETLGGMARVAKDGMQMAKDFGPEALKQQMAKVIPGLGIAVAAIEFAKSTKELGESIDSLNKASVLKRDALASFARDDGDEAAVNVFANDKSGAKVRVAKSGVETGANAIELSGAIATTAGGAHGAAAGAALSITAGVIKVGSKVVFAGIDWSAANKAMKKIREAQAGNYQAQVEVFEDSNFYAKMYLAILVKDGNPMAQKYLVNQGLQEGDLEGPTGLAILRDVLLTTAKQSNDLEVDDTLIGKMMGLGGKVVDGMRELTPADVAKGAATFVIAGGILAPVTLTLADYARKAATPAYDPEARYTVPEFVAHEVAGWPDTWAQAKALHIEHGLLDSATGLGAALTKAANASKAVAPDARFPAGQDEMVAAVRKALIEAIEATKAAMELAESVQLQAYLPGSMLPTKGPHQQAYQTMQSLRKAANSTIDVYWKRYDDMPPERPEWATPAITRVEVAAWNGFWTDGRREVGLPAGDGGVAKAIATAVAARASFQTEKEGKKKRQLALAYIETLDDVNDAALEALGIEGVNRRATARKAIDDFMLLLNKTRRELDEHLADAAGGGVLPPWASPAKAFDTLEPSEYLAEWKKVWNYAVKEGFAVGSDDAGLTDALATFQGHCDELETAAGNPKDVLKAVRAMEVGAGRVKKHAIEFGRKQRYATDPLKDYATSVRKTVVEKTEKAVQEAEGDANKIKFADQPTKDPRYLSSIDWRRTCADAVAKGAVLESKTATDKLSEALKTLKSTRVEYETGHLDAKRTGKKMRKLADAHLEALHVAAGAVAMARGLKRYDQNTRMSGYLHGIMSAVEAAEKNAQLVGYLDGTALLKATESFGPAKLDTSNWSANKKKALDNGVIPADKTGVKEAIEDLLKARSGDAATKKEKREALAGLLKSSKASSRNAKWTAYVDQMIGEAGKIV